jgi:hypothetical protein
MAKLTMDVKRNRIILGIGLAIIFYFGVKKFYKPKISGSSVNFSNANGEGGFIAKRYDSTRNATWIAYDNSDVVGFWKDGMIPVGTSVDA